MKIKSASEMGIKAESIGIQKKSKTHKGRKILEDREGKTVENAKKSIFIKGNKTSLTIMELMKDMHSLRGNDFSKLFLRKSHNVHPFEEVSAVESMAIKNDCSLFAVGTHQKKRPDNLIMGRLFAN